MAAAMPASSTITSKETGANDSGFSAGQRVQATCGSKEGMKGKILSRAGTRWLVDFEDQNAPRKYKQENLQRIDAYGHAITTKKKNRGRKAKKIKITSMNQKLCKIPANIADRFIASKRSANGHCIHLIIVGEMLTLKQEVDGSGNWRSALDAGRGRTGRTRPSFLVIKQSRTAALLVSYLPAATTGKAKMLQAANLTPLMTTLESVYPRVTKFQAHNHAEIASKRFEAYAAIEKPLSRTEIALAARDKEDSDTRQWLASRAPESKKHNSMIAVMAAAAVTKKKKK